MNPGEPPDPGVSTLEAQPASSKAPATLTHTTERGAPARGGTSIVPLYVGLMVERLPFLSNHYETVTVTESMYTVSLGCCSAVPAPGPNTGIVAIRLATSSPFTILPKIV